MKKLLNKLMILLIYLAFIFVGGVVGVMAAVGQYGPYQQPTLLDVLNLEILKPHHNFMTIGMLGGFLVVYIALNLLKKYGNIKST